MRKSDNKRPRYRSSIINMLIVLVVFAIIIGSSEFFLGYQSISSLNNDIVPNSILFHFEKSSIDAIMSADSYKQLFTEENNDLKPSDNVYPLIDMETENKYNKDTVNIVVIGDSFVWGHYCLNRNELFWRLLESDLRKKGYNCRVYGVGMVTANAYDEIRWLTKTSLVKDLDPDIVILGYVYNDPDPRNGIINYNYFPTGSYSAHFPFSNSLKKTVPNIYNAINNYIAAKKMYDDDFTDDYFLLPGNENVPIFITKGKFYEQYKKDFVIPLDEYAAQADFPIAYMTLPFAPVYTLQNALFKPIHELYSKYTNVVLYDSLGKFCHGFAAKKHSSNYSVNEVDPHPGSATNRFYADYIIDFLEKDYKDIIGKSVGEDLNDYSIMINECLPEKLNLSERVKTENSASYSLEYPSEMRKYEWMGYQFDSYLLNYPLGDDYIKLSFAQPVDIKSVEITGDKVQNIDLYYTRLNEKLRYDDHSILPFGTKSADGKVWTDTSSDKVMSLCIHADCINNDGSKLQIKINK
ncbi:MAG: SGNH/GDSL hydrolase family protein [Clostridia bacterium]|nr:SGNH/GDSL hydrolase family protein [Clostridia bacterium]